MLISLIVCLGLLVLFLSVLLVSRSQELKQSKLDYVRLTKVRDDDKHQVECKIRELIRYFWPDTVPWDVIIELETVSRGYYTNCRLLELLTLEIQKRGYENRQMQFDLGEPEEIFLKCVREEIVTARERYPDWKGLPALVEEVGEVAQALLDKGHDEVYAEAVQVAAMAMRMALDDEIVR